MPLSLYVDMPSELVEHAQPGEPAVYLVRLGEEEFELPATFDLRYHPSGHEPGWKMEFAVVDGVPRCQRYTIEASESGREVRSADLRDIRVEDLLELAATNAAFRREGNGRRVRMRRDLDDLRDGVSLGAVRRVRRGAKRKVTEDVLRRVADIYRRNLSDRPTEAVARALGVADRTARLYVRRARDAGFLGEAVQGRAGER